MTANTHNMTLYAPGLVQFSRTRGWVRHASDIPSCFPEVEPESALALGNNVSVTAIVDALRIGCRKWSESTWEQGSGLCIIAALRNKNHNDKT